MRLGNAYALVFAATTAAAAASCGLVQGLNDYDFQHGSGGAGGTSSSSSSSGHPTSTTSSSSSGGGATSSSSSGTGGTGGGPECTSASTCPDVPPGPCASLGQKVCQGGKCGIQYTPGDAPSQRYGTCKKTMCDVNGVATDVVDDTNVYDDGNPCTQEKCMGGTPSTVDLLKEACPLGAGMGICLPDPYVLNRITCSECDSAGGTPTCASGTCVKGKCVPAHCTNSVKDSTSSESDIDCGGPTSGCLKCADEKACLTSGSCASGVCTAGACAAPTCMDNVQNQNESDVDCGGNCSPCEDTAACVVANDCKSKVCQGNVCQMPTCTDGVQNGDETGIDCGGTSCPPCGS